MTEFDCFPILEKSKSRGYHIHLFLDSPLPARTVKLLMEHIAKEAGVQCEIFPKQEKLTSNNGIGNFMNLPLHGGSMKEGRTVFLNVQTFEPYPDQFEFLKKVHKTKAEDVQRWVSELRLDQTEVSSTPPQTEREVGSSGKLEPAIYLSHYKIPFTVKEEPDRTFYRFQECPFSENHTTPNKPEEAAIVQGRDGKLTFMCLHAHCQDRTWADVRRAISGDAPIFQFCRGYVAPPVSLIHKRGEGKSLSEIYNEPEPDEKYVVKPILSRGDKGFIVSSYKIGKTLFLIQLALCLAMGIPFLGFEIPSAVKVLYIRFELKEHRFRKRLVSMVKGLEGIDNIKVEPIFELVRGFNILEKKDFDWLLSLIEKHRPDVLLLDPLYKIASIDLKDTANAMPLIRRFDSIIEAYPDLLTIMAHHTRKTIGDAKEGWDSTYGPMFFFADMDFEIRIKAKHHKNPDFSFEYISNDVPVDSFTFKRNPETLLYYISNQKVDYKGEIKIMEYVGKNRPTKTALKDWLNVNLRLSRRRAQDTMKRMIEDGQILVQKGKGTRGHLSLPGGGLIESDQSNHWSG